MITPEEQLQDFSKTQSEPVVEQAPVFTIPGDAKIAFLAHMLTGVPFIRSYDIARVGFVEFATVSPAELSLIRRLVHRDEQYDPAATKQNRNSRLSAYLAVASIQKLELDGKDIRVLDSRSWDSPASYNAFLERIPLGLYEVLLSLYREFSELFDTLIRKVKDRSFWPTP